MSLTAHVGIGPAGSAVGEWVHDPAVGSLPRSSGYRAHPVVQVAPPVDPADDSPSTTHVPGAGRISSKGTRFAAERESGGE